MSRKMLEMIKVNHALSQSNVNNNTANTYFFSMANYDRIVFVVQAGSSNGAGDPLLTLEAIQATSVAGAGKVSMAATVTNTSIVGANVVNTIEIRADQMNTNGGFYYISCNISETNSNITRIGAVAVRSSARWPQTPAAMLS